jgi:hypothetical protein
LGAVPHHLGGYARTKMSNSTYCSYVINISNDPPYDQPAYRAFTWAGQFVKPIVERQLHDHYWFTYYGDHAKLRIWTTAEKHDELVPVIEKLLEHPALSRRLDGSGQPVESSLTLAEDLGSDRFRPRDYTPEKQLERAIKALVVLHSICDLVIHGLQVTQDGHFFVEGNDNAQQNPDGSFFQSIHHLFCNITQVPTSVWVKTDKIPLTDIQIDNLYNNGIISTIDVDEIRNFWKRLRVTF